MKSAPTFALWAATALACSAPRPLVTPTGPPDPRQLTEPQALAAIQEALTRAGVLARRGLLATLQADGGPVSLEVDVHFAEPLFGIEWVTGEDRARYGALLPDGSPASPLRIVTAAAGRGPVQVLVLDDRVYGFEGNALLVQRGAAGIEDAEQRVRRDVTDFVHYVRDQGATM